MTLLEEIRKETAALHSRLDTLELTKRLMHKQVAKADYSNYIQCFYALHALIEPLLYQEATHHLPNMHKNQRISALQADLELLNVPELVIEVPVETAYMSSKAYLGALYVMEGSRLGGRFIAKHLRECLPENEVPTFHFLEEAPEVGWKEILAFVSTSEHNQRTEIIASAKYMFKFVEEVLERAFTELNEKNKL